MTSGYAVATLVVFIFSIFFVIRPVSIPTPRPIPRIPLNLTTAPILAIALLWASQCLGPTVIRNGIVGTEGVKPYNILILFFSLAYMAITLDVTGILQAAAFWVSNKGGNSGWKLYLYFYVMLTLLSILLGNDPVILSGTAFLVYYTEVANLDPKAWIMAEFAAANTASMVLFVGNPTNVVICEGFSVNDAAFTLYTILPFLACNGFCFAALALQFRKQVPRKLTRTTHRDPRSALLDPVGAWVGSLMLGSALILCLVVSFFGVDVWMISLPFALTKFLFDLGWDHYRYTHGIPMLGRKALEEEFGEVSAVEGHQHTEDTLSRCPLPIDVKQSSSFPLDEEIAVSAHPDPAKIEPRVVAERFDKDSGVEIQRPTEDTSARHPSPTVEQSPSFPSDEETAVSRPETAKIECKAVEEGSDKDSVAGAHEPTEDIFSHHAHLTVQRSSSFPLHEGIQSHPDIASKTALQPGPKMVPIPESETLPQPTPSREGKTKLPYIFRWYQSFTGDLYRNLDAHFPTFITALPRLPFSLIPFAFSQFILIEALNHQGWVNLFANWLVRASHGQMHPTIWLIGVLGVILCNLSGTNIGATILLTKVVRAAALPYDTNRAAAIALAVASNIGAVSFTFSASLAGLLWRNILAQKGIHVRQRDFAFWNLLPLLAMTAVGLGVVSAELAVLFRS